MSEQQQQPEAPILYKSNEEMVGDIWEQAANEVDAMKDLEVSGKYTFGFNNDKVAMPANILATYEFPAGCPVKFLDGFDENGTFIGYKQACKGLTWSAENDTEEYTKWKWFVDAATFMCVSRDFSLWVNSVVQNRNVSPQTAFASLLASFHNTWHQYVKDGSENMFMTIVSPESRKKLLECAKRIRIENRHMEYNGCDKAGHAFSDDDEEVAEPVAKKVKVTEENAQQQ